MNRRSLVLASTGWLAVVAAASAVTWAVIGTAGQQVLSAVEPVSIPTTARGPEQPAAPRTPGTPSTSQRGAPSVTPAGPPPVDRSWQGVDGTVVVRCAEGKVSLRAATPDDGHRVEIGSRGPQEVEVSFHRTVGPDTESDSDAGSEVQVRARCVRGVPQFTRSTETDD